MSGAKYKMLSIEYNEEFFGPDDADLKLVEEIFNSYNLKFSITF